MSNSLPPKVQYLALREEIKELFKRGYNYKNAYNILSEKGSLKMSYTNFCRYINNLGQSKQEDKKKLIDDDFEQATRDNVNKFIGIEKTNFGQKDYDYEENI